ncbi:MAG: DUF2442 domain-containing protein [Pedobacter sp.]|nr:DUF2442 domain-containing protein [Chitinophagaceae bacterium]
MNLPVIISVEALSKYQISIAFNTGDSGIIQLNALAQKGVFNSWDENNNFFKLAVVRNGRAIEWPDEIDMCADSLLQTLQASYSSQKQLHATD